MSQSVARLRGLCCTSAHGRIGKVNVPEATNEVLRVKYEVLRGYAGMYRVNVPKAASVREWGRVKV